MSKHNLSGARDRLLADLSRRRFVTGLAIGGAATAAGLARWPAFASPNQAAGDVPQLRGSEFDLAIGRSPVNFTGRARMATTVNGSLPAPILRWREGDTVTLRVANHLRDASTSIHWHGIILPANMDGVPGLSFAGIKPGEAYDYRFTLNQSGTDGYGGSGVGNKQADYAQFKYKPNDGTNSGSEVTMKVDISPVADKPTLSFGSSDVGIAGQHLAPRQRVQGLVHRVSLGVGVEFGGDMSVAGPNWLCATARACFFCATSTSGLPSREVMTFQ